MEATNINFEEMLWLFRNIYQCQIAKLINFEEIHWFSEIYIYLFLNTKYQFLKKSIGFQKYIPVFGIQKYQF